MEETQLEKLSPPPDSALALRQGTAGKILQLHIVLYLWCIHMAQPGFQYHLNK